MLSRFVLVLAFLLSANPGFCQEPNPPTPADPTAENSDSLDRGMTAKEVLDQLGIKPKSGTISLPGGLAQLNLPPELGYLDAEQTKTVVEKLWGNPGGTEFLGMIVKDAEDILAEDGVSAIITYDDSGYISDKDAASINYSDLLKQMQSGEAEDNKQRQEQGFPTMHLVGWAEAPRYDASSNKLFWAKEIAVSGDTKHTLNYSIRALGRQGVLELNFVGTIEQLQKVKELAPKVLSAVTFTPGNKYADFNANTDRVAGYGLAALVAGGVAAKAGLFKVLIAALIAGKKFVIIGAIAVFAILGKLFTGRKKAE